MGMRGHQMPKTVVTLPDHQHHLYSHPALPNHNHYAHSSHAHHHAHSTYAHSPPLLVVSPTSPSKDSAHLPEIVAREPQRKRHVAAPVTNCTSWLHTEGESDSSQRVSTSLASASSSSPSAAPLRQGFKGSRIPVRSARRAGQRRSTGGEGAPPRYFRSRSLTKLSLEEEAMTRAFRLGSSRSPPSSPRSPHSPHSPASPSPSPRGERKKKDERSGGGGGGGGGHRRAPRNGISPPGTPLSPPHCSRHAQHAHAPASPHALRRHRHASPPRLEHEPYETPQYFTFHLTLRSPARAASQGRARLGARNDGNSYSTSDTIASSAARRCVEDMILQSCTLSRSALPQSTRVPRTIHMPQVPRADHSDGEIRTDFQGRRRDGEREEGREEREMEERDNREAEEREEQRREEEKESGCLNDDGSSSGGGGGKDHHSLGASFDFNIPEDFQCNSFGIVDCLTSVMKEPDTDDSESCSSDYGSGLGTSPPAKFSDTDSTIEASAVSSDLPLKGFPTPRPSALARRKKPDMGSIRWRSCAELSQNFHPSPASSVLKRQWSDRSLQARLQEQALRGMSVEVYDGDVGVSVLTLSKNGNSSSSSALKRSGQRHAKARVEGDVAAEVEAKLLRDESRDSQDLNDSLAVEASGSDLEVDEGEGDEEEEAMETDESAPPLPPSEPMKVPLVGSRSSSRKNRTNGRQRASTKARTGKMLAKSKEQDNSVTSTTGRSSGSPVCIRRPLKDDVMLAIKIGHLKDKDMDQVLGIQEDDGSGPGLSEEEHEVPTSRELAGYRAALAVDVANVYF
ncbi:uncharacterized protein LOC122259495 [Penaeus japonicus]|uniref:uncharacterized protein LOC122259495 n=1 Tax=Penaeus japonicus TaxID=27405 RepID=UPI001C7145CC|nr:uncharacterized protein LOC122259495 [Penaeus japonicus]XP_042882245.1 uncharacterized protein LOC122259495 [Penaeus japonicus]